MLKVTNNICQDIITDDAGNTEIRDVAVKLYGLWFVIEQGGAIREADPEEAREFALAPQVNERHNIEALKVMDVEAFTKDRLLLEDESGNSVLFVLCSQELHSELKEKIIQFIEEGGDINLRNKDGYTPLHAAARNGLIENVNFLLAHGADATIAANDGTLPYQSAMKASMKASQPNLVDILRSSALERQLGEAAAESMDAPSSRMKF
jgi:hypothetical protein